MEEVTRRSQRGREQSLEEDPTKVKTDKNTTIKQISRQTSVNHSQYIHYKVFLSAINERNFGRFSTLQVNTLNEQEHEKLKQAQILEKLQQAFDASDTEGSENESVIEAFDMWSPSGPTDAQTLALMLQEQLDAINNEIR